MFTEELYRAVVEQNNRLAATFPGTASLSDAAEAIIMRHWLLMLPNDVGVRSLHRENYDISERSKHLYGERRQVYEVCRFAFVGTRELVPAPPNRARFKRTRQYSDPLDALAEFWAIDCGLECVDGKWIKRSELP